MCGAMVILKAFAGVPGFRSLVYNRVRACTVNDHNERDARPDIPDTPEATATPQPDTAARIRAGIDRALQHDALTLQHRVRASEARVKCGHLREQHHHHGDAERIARQKKERAARSVTSVE